MKNTVPVIVQAVAKHSYWVESIFTGLRQSAEKSDYELEFIENAEGISKSDYSYCDSIIVIGYVVGWLEQTVDILLKKGFQPIIVNTWISSSMLKHCNGVFSDLEKSVEECINYLSASGRKNISLFGVNNLSLADRLKAQTFKRLSAGCNERDEELIFPADNPIEKYIEGFIKNFEEKEIDAVICTNDTVAIMLINRMLKYGFKIPEDLYVIAMGNSLLGQKIQIPLSSVDFNYEELGRQAFALWRYILRSTEKVHIELTIPCKFIPRASTGNFAVVETKCSSVLDDELLDENIETNCDGFYEDIDIQKITMFEVFLRSCDEIDYLVLEGILQGKSDAKMAEQYNISDRAIRYRINKMTKKLCVQTRDEVVNIVRELRAFNGEY